MGTEEEEEKERPDAERKSRQISDDNMERPEGSSKKSAASVSSLQQSALTFVVSNYAYGKIFKSSLCILGAKRGHCAAPELIQ